MNDASDFDPAAHILDRPTLLSRFGQPRDYTLVFTNGCFDLLHRGHASLLARARTLGDRLVVGVNADESVRHLKGSGRPYMPVSDRAYLLASLRCVDAVTVFDEETPLALIESLVPDVLVKGGDYRVEEIVGAEHVRALGGRVCTLPLEEGLSTSELVLRLRNRG